MTIEVHTPDGSSFAFPDGMPQEDITKALDAHFGQAAPAAADASGAKPDTSVSADNLVRAGARGVPIVGGLLDKANAATYAALAPVFPSDKTVSQAGSFGDRYSENLAREKAKDEGFDAAHPIVSTGAQLTGGVAATLPVAATATGAKLLGLTGSTVPGMIARGAASGGAIGALDSAARGGDVGTGAGVGALTGGAAPVVGRAVGSAVQGARNFLHPVLAAPGNLVHVAGVDVPVSTGQATGDVATQMMENTALRGGEGQAAQKVADQFFNGLQQPGVEDARQSVGRGLDRFGQHIASDPQAAAEMVGESTSKIAQASKQNYGDLYKEALAMPGEIHAGALEGIGQKIKSKLTLGDNPVIVDDVTTPVASRALQYIDDTLSRLKITNHADPFGQPNPENIVGVNLQGIDQVRKGLVTMATSAERGSADRRAVGRIIGAFDDHVEDSMSNGLFTGDDRALDALKDARAAYKQHQQLFRSQGQGDDVGKAMERIVNYNNGQGATSNEIANYLFGEARVGGSGLSVRLAQRMRGVLGEESPEWSGIRQGLWSRLTDATEGRTDMGPQKASERIFEFLNGSGKAMSQVLFSPEERQQMTQYAGLLKQLVPKPGTVNYSNTAPVLAMLAKNALKGITIGLGAEVAGPAGAVAGISANAALKSIGERSAAGRIARSLYRSPTDNAAEEAGLRRAANAASVAQRATIPEFTHP